MIDIHCHILPGVDDGAADVGLALEMARIAVADGTTEIVATPHVFDGTFENTRESAEAALRELRAALEREAIPLEVHLGSDCHLDERIFAPEHAKDVLTIAGGKYLLIEFPHELVPPRVEDTLFRLRTKGLVPILTHPERNAELQKSGGIERVAAWVEAGLLTQVTGESLTGGFGRKPKAVAEELVRRGLCHFVASDAHSPTWRRPVLSAARALLERIGRSGDAERLLEENPGRAIRGAAIAAIHEEAAERPRPARGFFFRR